MKYRTADVLVLWQHQIVKQIATVADALAEGKHLWGIPVEHQGQGGLTMSKGKRNRQKRKVTTVDALENRLRDLSNKRQKHSDRIGVLDRKIAATEGEIEIAKEEAAEAAAAGADE